MINRVSITFTFGILILGFLISQAAEPSPWSNCNFSIELTDKIEKWLNKSLKEAQKAIEKGIEYDGKVHKLEQCKIDEINSLFKRLKFEYDCTCGDCGIGGPSHPNAPGNPFITICQPLDMYLNRTNNDLNQPPKTLCGCIQGLIVHELVHAAGDPTEEGAVDCSKMLYPCATDGYADETPDHKNCKCCEKAGK